MGLRASLARRRITRQLSRKKKFVALSIEPVVVRRTGEEATHERRSNQENEQCESW